MKLESHREPHTYFCIGFYSCRIRSLYHKYSCIRRAVWDSRKCRAENSFQLCRLEHIRQYLNTHRDASVWIAGGGKEVGGVKPPTVFSAPLTHCQIMFWGSTILYYIQRIYITILVGFRPSKSSTTQLIFHNSNTDEQTDRQINQQTNRHYKRLKHWFANKKHIENSKNYKRWYYSAAHWHRVSVMRAISPSVIFAVFDVQVLKCCR